MKEFLYIMLASIFSIVVNAEDAFYGVKQPTYLNTNPCIGTRCLLMNNNPNYVGMRLNGSASSQYPFGFGENIKYKINPYAPKNIGNKNGWVTGGEFDVEFSF